MPRHSQGRASLTVRVRMGGRERVLELVGDNKGGPATGYLTFSARLARALIGAKDGKIIDLEKSVKVAELLELCW